MSKSTYRHVVEIYGKEIITENGNEGKKRMEVIIKELLQPKSYCIRCVFRYICTTRKVFLFQQFTERLLVNLLQYLFEYYFESGEKMEEEGMGEEKKEKEGIIGEEEKQQLFALPHQICGLCFGLIQGDFLEYDEKNNIDDFFPRNEGDRNNNLKEIKKQLLKSLEECEYDYRDFQFCLTQPHSSTLREYSLLHYFRTHYPELKINAEEMITIKEVFKWSVAKIVPPSLRFKPESLFTIKLIFTHDESIDEQNQMVEHLERLGKTKKKRRNRFKKYKEESITNTPPILSMPDISSVFSSISFSELQSKFTIWPIKEVKETTKMEVQYEHGYAYLAGRYNKYSRNLSQTTWVIDGQKKTESAIDELIIPLSLPLLRSPRCTFSASGREDLDVRMLGNGRPFILEFFDPKRAYPTPSQLAELQKQINESTSLIQIHHLQLVTRKECNILKEGEEKKKKTYRCIVYLSKECTEEDFKKLDEVKELVVDQQTPIRVLHRRTLATRKKTIHSLQYQVINNHFIVLDLETQAGTYVKEFVHGDLGRTNPNIGSILGCDADILQLDVLSIDIDWPPPIDQ